VATCFWLYGIAEHSLISNGHKGSKFWLTCDMQSMFWPRTARSRACSDLYGTCEACFDLCRPEMEPILTHIGHQWSTLCWPVWNVRSMFHKCSDDSAKCQQTLVDVARLPRPFVDGTRTTNALAAGQINLHNNVHIYTHSWPCVTIRQTTHHLLAVTSVNTNYWFKRFLFNFRLLRVRTVTPQNSRNSFPGNFCNLAVWIQGKTAAVKNQRT